MLVPTPKVCPPLNTSADIGTNIECLFYMRAKMIHKNRQYRRIYWVREALFAALKAGNLELFRFHLQEYLKFGSTERQAILYEIPERTLRRLSSHNSDPKLSQLMKIFRYMNRVDP